jgi:hypothetical protein
MRDNRLLGATVSRGKWASLDSTYRAPSCSSFVLFSLPEWLFKPSGPVARLIECVAQLCVMHHTEGSKGAVSKVGGQSRSSSFIRSDCGVGAALLCAWLRMLWDTAVV